MLLHKTIEYVLYPVKYIFPLIFLVVFYMGISLLVKNVFKLYTFDSGIVISVNDENEPSGGGFPNTIDFNLRGFKDNNIYIITTGINNKIQIGDTLEFKNYHDGNQIAFKKNGIQYTEPNSIYDYLLPLISMVIGWFYYKLYILPFYQKYIKKHDEI